MSAAGAVIDFLFQVEATCSTNMYAGAKVGATSWAPKEHFG